MESVKKIKKLDLTIKNAFDFQMKIKNDVENGDIHTLKIDELVNIDISGIQLLISFLEIQPGNMIEVSKVDPELAGLIEKTGFSNIIKYNK